MTEDVQIPLEDLPLFKRDARYIGGKGRFSTATSVRFINPQTLVCCSLLGRKIYLIRFDSADGSHELLASTHTLHDGRTTATDLCDIDGQGHVLTSNCNSTSLGLYRYEDNATIRHVRDLPTQCARNFCHGARFCGPDVVVATMSRHAYGAYFFDLQTMTKLLHVKTDHPSKDICFLPNNQAILITTKGTPTRGPQAAYESESLLVEYDLEHKRYSILKKKTYKAGQFDAAVIHGNRLYITDSGRNAVLIIDVSTLEQVGQLDGYRFPHGIDINYGMLAVTSYGTNSIHVRRLDLAS